MFENMRDSESKGMSITHDRSRAICANATLTIYLLTSCCLYAYLYDIVKRAREKRKKEAK